MTRIAFITLFLGLVIGPHKVAMNVTGPAARIEMEVDGRTATEITKPWSGIIDFGPRLLPHRLVARAFDDRGNEVARVEQTVNLPHSLSEIQIVLQRNNAGRPVAVHVLWQSLEADRPREIVASLDGMPLTIDAQLRGAIPEVDLQRPHVLRVRAVGTSGIAAETEVAFGGGLEEQALAHLTPIAVRVKPGTSPDFNRVLRIGNEAARVAAVEDLPGRIIVVRHPVAIEAATKLDPGGFLYRHPASGPLPSDASPHERPVVTFVWPVARHVDASAGADLFDWSKPYPFEAEADLKILLTRMRSPESRALRFADAVAAGALRAMRAREPRALVLILGQSANDSSMLRPEQVREYLRAVGVPLYVWSLGPLSDTQGWGEATDISRPAAFRAAFEALRNDLKSQRIVWIEGDHLPADVQVTGGDIETVAQNHQP